ncbi:afadin- and alpha-actinin-binding protein [Alosa pseudoharengus]|uniref:afadin- and alpha-actinin-binding protein n=1 Tax=Alosa pseudoharengus TaxID=34774 RepID=UPI003F8A14FA
MDRLEIRILEVVYAEVLRSPNSTTENKMAQKQPLVVRTSPPVNEASQSVLMSSHRERTASLREQLVERDQHVARLQDALKRERDKCGRLQSRCGQQVAELRRRELQNNRLKERLLTDKHKDKGPAMEMLNALPKSLAKKDHAPRGTRSEGRREEEALRLILERREAELREAMKLRHAITTLLHKLRTDMEQTLHVLLSDKQEEPDSQRLVQSEVVLGDHVTGGVVKEWVRVQKVLKEIHAQGGYAGATDQEKQLVQLERELEESQQLVRLQQQLLQDSVTPALPAPLIDSYYLEEWERLQEQRVELDRQRRSFERERQAFTDAAIRLGHERCQFEQQKASLVWQQYLFNSPPVKLSAHHSRRVSPAIKIYLADDPLPNSPDSLCPATPSSTASDQSPGSPGHQEVTTPSTPELYSALRLPYPRRSAGTPSPTECWRGGGGTERSHRAPRRRDHDYSF